MDGTNGKTNIQPSNHSPRSQNIGRQELQGSNRDQQKVVQKKKRSTEGCPEEKKL